MKTKDTNGHTHIIRKGDNIPTSKLIILGLQHTFTMFGATVLVPILTGLDISVALFMAGIGTLLFHVITKFRMPVFLGSSFAFIAPVLAVATMPSYGLPYAGGGMVVAGLIYVVVSLLVYKFGAQRILSFFPPIVTGPIIIVIGLKLAPVAVTSAQENWFLAAVAFCVVAGVSIFAKGFAKVLPVLFGLIAGYVVALITGNVDLSPIREAAIIGLPKFTVARFALEPIMVIAPVAVATMVEHIGDVLAIGETTDEDYVKEPGLHRTLIGDGIATSIAAMLGGPANTTYSENTGVLALTGVHAPIVMRVAACFAILLGVVPKLGAIIATIPNAVIGGISIILFGMIASIGARTLVENKVDFTKSRNLIISAVILVLGIGGATLPIRLGSITIEIAGMALAAIVGIILNKALPEK